MRAVLVVAAVVYSAAVAGQAGAAVHRAGLRLVDDSTPATLRGTGFQPREHVRVVIVAGTSRTVRRTVATIRGRFVLRLHGEDVNACAGFSASAVGNLGTRASFKRAPGQCPQP
jgi:uncharacterized NAD-dependent epimerase/dehydratase family protein